MDDRRANSFRLRWQGGNFQLWFVKFRFLAWLSILLAALSAVSAQEGTGSEASAASDELKVATVDIQSLFRNHPKTLAAEREIDLARAEVQKEGQLAKNEIEAKKQVLERRAKEIREGEASEAELAQAQRELPVLLREIQLAEKEKQNKRDAANNRLNQQMVRRMEGILAEIVEAAAKKGEDAGFDLVIDTSGDNSSQAAPILFSRNATDLTEVLRKELSNLEKSKR